MNSPVMQGLNLNTPAFVKNAKLVAWVADMVALCKPADVYWCDGSQAEYDRLAAAGMEFAGPPVDFGTSSAIYGKDPFGNVIELYEIRDERIAQIAPRE